MRHGTCRDYETYPYNQTFISFFVNHVDRVRKNHHSINNQDSVQKCGAHAGLVINVE